jgi:hypothetical protein
MAERYQLPRSCVPPTTRRKDCGCPPSGGSESGKTRCIREREDMVAFQGSHPPFKGDSPYLRLLQHAPRSSPYGARSGSHASCKLAQSRRSQTAARGACNRPAVTSVPPLSPRPAGERADNRAGGMQPRQVGAPLRLPMHPGMEAQAHASCNRRAGCYVRATAPPHAPLPRLLDYGTSTVTRGNPAYDPAVPAGHDGQYGQKWAGSNGGGRRT